MEACDDTRLLLLESNFVIPSQNPVCGRSASLVAAIVNEVPNARELFAEKYGPPLSFLIGRHCRERAGQFHAAVADATIDAVLRHDISTDEELPRLIRLMFRRLLPEYEEDLTVYRARVLDEIGKTHSKEINEISQELKIFKPGQLEALSRFYIKGESILAICSDLDVSQDAFSDTRKVAWQIVRLALSDSPTPRRRPSRVIKTEFKRTVVAG